MKDEKRDLDHMDPWDRGIYQTGSVEPPKKNSATVAVLLVAVVFLTGIVAILGVMNVRLFTKLGSTKGDMSLSLQPPQNGNLQVLPDGTLGAYRSDTTITLETQPQTTDDSSVNDGLPLQDIYAQCISSVVSITCQSGRSTSSGTGVVLSGDGYIVTNCHVVEDAEQIIVQLSDDRRLQATLVGADAASDLAVLHVTADDLTPARFGDSEDIRVGDTVCAIGDPLGVELRGTMTNGIISAINRNITTGGRTMTLIQTNAALNSGNSGGPLINRHGQVIGINTMKIGDYMSVTGVEGLGFAIPSVTVKSIVDQLIAQGYVSGRPSLGIDGETVSELYQYYYQLPKGLFITKVAEGSNAQVNGLVEGDILLSIDGKDILDPEGLITALYDHEVGDTIDVVIYRNNKCYSVQLQIEEAKN